MKGLLESGLHCGDSFVRQRQWHACCICSLGLFPAAQKCFQGSDVLQEAMGCAVVYVEHADKVLLVCNLDWVGALTLWGAWSSFLVLASLCCMGLGQGGLNTVFMLLGRLLQAAEKGCCCCCVGCEVQSSKCSRPVWRNVLHVCRLPCMALKQHNSAAPLFALCHNRHIRRHASVWTIMGCICCCCLSAAAQKNGSHGCALEGHWLCSGVCWTSG